MTPEPPPQQPPRGEGPQREQPPHGQEPQRAPGDYRPDLRPMLILAGLLAAIILGWIILGPLILPA